MIGIGHIGVGGMARARAAKFLQRNDVQLVAGWSRGQRNLAEYTELSGGEAIRDWQAVVTDPHVQAVCVGTPTSTHAEYALAALGAGKHVLVECPAVGDLADFDAMVEAAERNQVVLYVASNYRFDTTAQAIAYAAPRVGTVLLVRGDSSWRPEPPRTWYFDRKLSGGVFPCAHLYQFTLFDPLGPASSVQAAFGGKSDDFGVAIVRYNSGAAGVATGGFQRQGTRDFALVGTEGILRADQHGTFGITREGRVEPVSTQPVDPTTEDNAAFIRCIRGEQDWRAHARHERAIHAVAIGAQRSAETGQVIALGQGAAAH